MQDTLYADVLFFINFSMDFVSLYITSKLLSLPSKTVRYVLSAVIGGVFGVLCVIFPPSRLVSFALSFAVSFLMIRIVSGRGSFFLHVKNTAVLWGVAALISGGVSLVLSLGRDYSGLSVGFSKGQSSFFVLSLGAFLCLLLSKLFVSAPKCTSCQVVLRDREKQVSFSALVDSGNLVREPTSGLSVIFLKKEVFEKLYGAEDTAGISSGRVECMTRSRLALRCVRVSGVNGDKLLFGVIPQDITLLYNKKSKRVKALVVPENKGDYGGREGLVPATLMN